MGKIKKSKYIINGRQLSGQIGGVQRYLRETLRELDKIASKDEIIIAVSRKAKDIPEYNNLKVLKIGLFDGILWEQLDFAFYLLKNGYKGVNLCTAVPLLYPFGINAIHDIMPIRYPEVKRAFKPWNYLLLKLNYYMACRFSDRIITVSETSKTDIMNYYNVSSGDIDIIPNSWQHMERIEPIEFEADYIEKSNYYLGLSSNRWQKNFKWIEDVALNNPGSEFVIVGAEDLQQKDEEKRCITNVHYTGFLDDGQIKWLYSNCKAFLFPSICEGFGIPPLEALSCGAKVIISNTSCMPEIFGAAGVYIDPFDSDVNVDEISLKCNQIGSEQIEKTLGNYSWAKSSAKLLNLLRQ